jgi:hypothetical protein
MTNIIQSSIAPEHIQAAINYYQYLLLPVGAAIWHGVLKIAPWAQSQGGLFRGVGRFFWVPKPKPTEPPKA